MAEGHVMSTGADRCAETIRSPPTFWSGGWMRCIKLGGPNITWRQPCAPYFSC
jgi:hypothetical protein